MLLKVAAVFYALVAVWGIVQLIWPRESGDRMIILGLSVSVTAHLVAIAARTVEIGTFPMANFHDGLSTFGGLKFLQDLSERWIWKRLKML